MARQIADIWHERLYRHLGRQQEARLEAGAAIVRRYASELASSDPLR